MLSIERLLKDLTWCVQSEPLILSDDSGIWPAIDWLQQFSLPDQLENFPQPRHPHHFRLGKHFENLLTAWMNHEPRVEIIETNLQIIEKNLTLGEFDYLLKLDHTTEHWEVAVKFYLASHPTPELHDYYGPNTADRFDLKYGRLIDHQLRLSSHPVVASQLDEHGINIRNTRCLLKGRLFYPWKTGAMTLPDIINPTHETGWWIHENGLDPEAFQRTVYLAKQHWLAPVDSSDGLTVMDYPDLKEFLQLPETEQATHIAIVDDEGVEVSRGFVVKQAWLDRIPNQTS